MSIKTELQNEVITIVKNYNRTCLVTNSKLKQTLSEHEN